MIGILSRFEDDLHGHALHNLDVVAGGILRRQQAEFCTGRSGDAVDVPLEFAIEAIDGDLRALPWLDALQLRFLVVGRDPDVAERYQREQWLPRLDDLTGFNRFPADDSGRRRRDLRALQVQLRLG